MVGVSGWRAHVLDDPLVLEPPEAGRLCDLGVGHHVLGGDREGRDVEDDQPPPAFGFLGGRSPGLQRQDESWPGPSRGTAGITPTTADSGLHWFTSTTGRSTGSRRTTIRTVASARGILDRARCFGWTSRMPTHRGGFRTVCPTAVSSRELAEVLAARLDAVAPPGVRVRAEGSAVLVARGAMQLGGSAAPELVTRRTDDRQVETVALSTISGVQDVFAEELAQPWPASSGEMPAPDVRIEAGVLLAWFGTREHPSLSLRSYPLPSR